MWVGRLGDVAPKEYESLQMTGTEPHGVDAFETCGNSNALRSAAVRKERALLRWLARLVPLHEIGTAGRVLLSRLQMSNCMTTATEHRYVVTDDQILGGEPIIEGTRTPVRAIVEIYRLGVPAEEIPNRLPHLSLAQVFDALSYYNDHPQEINGYIERNLVPGDKIDLLVKS